MNPSREEQLEKLAERTRIRWGIHNQFCPDVITMIYKLKKEGEIKNYALVSNIELPDEEAEFDPHEKILKIRTSTFYAANDPYGRPGKPRARFTIAHEVGHVLRHHKRVRHRSISDKTIEKIVLQTRVDEIEANRFAGALLMPTHLIDLDVLRTPVMLAEKFQVSQHAAEIRFEEIQRISRRQKGIKRKLPESVRDFLLEAKRRGLKVDSLDDTGDD